MLLGMNILQHTIIDFNTQRLEITKIPLHNKNYRKKIKMGLQLDLGKLRIHGMAGPPAYHCPASHLTLVKTTSQPTAAVTSTSKKTVQKSTSQPTAAVTSTSKKTV